MNNKNFLHNIYSSLTMISVAAELFGSYSIVADVFNFEKQNPHYMQYPNSFLMAPLGNISNAHMLELVLGLTFGLSLAKIIDISNKKDAYPTGTIFRPMRLDA